MNLLVVSLLGCMEPAPARGIPRVCDAVEVFYDGVDGACDGGDDFDADGDGYPRDVDCHDFDAAVFPGAPGDVPYDGVDTDCSGNNDFDADGDGWFPAGMEGDFAEYVFNYLDGVAPDHYPGDCDDSDAQVNPSAEEVFYDGVDANCDGENDFDADADGYVAVGYVGQGGGFGGGDCDDTRSGVSPAHSERPSSPHDEDCDGNPQSAALGVLDATFSGIRGAKLVRGPVTSMLVMDVESAPGFGVVHQSIIALGMGAVGGPMGRPSVLNLTEGGRAFDTALRLDGFDLAVVGEDTLETVSVLDVAGFAMVHLGSTWEGLGVGGQPVYTWSGLALCGAQQSVWQGETLPGAQWCGRWEKGLVRCEGACTLHEREVTPFLPSTPSRLGQGWMVLDQQVLGADGQVWVERASDADQDGEVLAWIADGEVFVRGPWGEVGPLSTHAWGWALVGEQPVRRAFEADQVFVDVRGQFATVWAVDRSRDAVAFARFAP